MLFKVIGQKKTRNKILKESLDVMRHLLLGEVKQKVKILSRPKEAIAWIE